MVGITDLRRLIDEAQRMPIDQAACLYYSAYKLSQRCWSVEALRLGELARNDDMVVPEV